MKTQFENETQEGKVYISGFDLLEVDFCIEGEKLYMDFSEYEFEQLVGGAENMQESEYIDKYNKVYDFVYEKCTEEAEKLGFKFNKD